MVTIYCKQNLCHSPFYGKEEARIMAGIALLMMLIHHFFGFQYYRLDSNWFYEPFKIAGVSLERIFASAGKLCVAIFAFMSGYAIWINRKKYIGLKYVAGRAAEFLLNYWIIVFLFYIYACATGDRRPDAGTLLQNLYGGATGPGFPYVNVAFAWYVYFYIVLLMLSPILLRLTYRLTWIQDVLLLIFLQFLHWGLQISGIDSAFHSISITLISGTLIASVFGLLVAKWDVFGRVESICRNHPTALGCCLIVSVLSIRQIFLLSGINTGLSEALFAGTFVFASILMFKHSGTATIRKILIWIGINSMNMWFLHSIFFTGSRPWQHILYFPHYSILILLWGIILLIPGAIGVSWIQKRILSWCKQLSGVLTTSK